MASGVTAEAKVALAAEAREALEAEQVEEDEETMSHKERRPSLNSFFYLSLPLPLERKDMGLSLCHLPRDRASKDIP